MFYPVPPRVQLDDAEYSLAVEASSEVRDTAAHIVSASLCRFRALLSKGWSPRTAYPGSVDLGRWVPGDPSGQCGVSAAWLAEELASTYGIESTFCRGNLFFGSRKEHDLIDHCWLELSDAEGETLVLDLTCDQANGFDKQFLLESKKALVKENVWFVTRDRVSRTELPKNRVWPRYNMLLRNLQGASD